MYLTEQLKRFGSIDGYLIEKGMTQEEIDSNKHEVVKYPKKEIEYCYEEVGQDTEIRKVPIEEIHDYARLESKCNGVSWYYHFNGRFFDSDYTPTFEKIRFSRLFEQWKDMNISEIRRLYEEQPSSFNSFYFIKYIDEHGRTYYYQEADGSHRLVVGKVIGVKHVFQSRSTVYKADREKLRLFRKVQDIENKRDTFLSTSVLFEKSERPVKPVLVKNFVISSDKETYIRAKATDFDRLYKLVKYKPEAASGEIEEAGLFVDNMAYVERNVIKALIERRSSVKRLFNLKLRHKLYSSYSDHVSFSGRKKDEAVGKLTDYFEYELYLLKHKDNDKYTEKMKQLKERYNQLKQGK
ncbi:hypothetical protein CW676_07820 [Macrococcoides caseolyticum]|uniref:hypothetical protein n=1 Tax=Macrococcoides caseolyticum TaxID=69966 RepID=UPI000C33C7A3|nr:hypothetical protein [Macrococcus caseolyticus]PKE06439.1 hypothetical protein CW692_08370 [Macrococcus caseolyticus]PKE23562.1 hypothetical protein CW689_08450 [Macrococcus caseolyticus]PKE52900.1 hypothetical protein CW676_07820 [Macrococcus caseolyticus]PKF37593.1 hypothetical protein CW681_11315 [Macrococcus caseolyticus]